MRPIVLADDWKDYGDRSSVPGYDIALSCDKCKVVWNGCAAEPCCPECGDHADFDKQMDYRRSMHG